MYRSSQREEEEVESPMDRLRSPLGCVVPRGWAFKVPNFRSIKKLFVEREREKKGKESLTGRAQWLALGGDGKRARRKGYSLEEEGEGGETSNTGECVGRARRGEDER